MSARIALGIALWASLIVGIVGLYADASAPTGLVVGVGAGVLGTHAVGRVRARWLRLRSWPRPDAMELETGPRRVLLVETGLGGTE